MKNRDKENSKDKNHTNIILFPEYEELKMEIEELRIQLSMLVLERDELLYVTCKNIEMSYVLTFGSLEHKLYERQCEFLRLKRKIDLIQTKKNRQERIDLSKIEEILDLEFKEYQKALEEQIHKMNKMISRSQGEVLTEAEEKELKKIYRRIVKMLHPDLNSDLNEAKKQMFQNAVDAYKNGDLHTLRIINEMLQEPVLPDMGEHVMVQLMKEKERLILILQEIRDDIVTIKSKFPYTANSILADLKRVKEYMSELRDMIEQLEETIRTYSERLKEMLR